MAAPPETLSHLLLAHFDRSSRDMPWRRTSDPYAIWVSEVMLQQTRVETVIPYYEQWLERYPTIEALAEAEEEMVLRSWEGLGYYSRARNLHAAARVVRESHGGRVPDTAATLLELPGIGAYTAGAVSSIAYGRPEPAIDGNARRVFSRLFDLENPTFPALQKIAKDYIPLDRPGDFNQAIMELGSTICTPQRPHCTACPVHSLCKAFANGTVSLRPGRAPQKQIPSFDVATVVLICEDQRTLLVQRPRNGLLAKFWEFPAAIVSAHLLSRTAREIAARHGITTRKRAQRLDALKHAFSHRIETYHPFVFRCAEVTDVVCDVPSRWVTRDELHILPLPVAQRRIAHAAGL